MTSYAGRVDGEPGSVSVGPQTLDAAGRVLPYVDMDRVDVDGYVIDLGMHPSGSVHISALGPRTDAFLAELDEQRSRARRAALLQWTGTSQLSEFTQAPGAAGESPVRIHVFADGFTVEPRNGLPELVPYSLVEKVDRDGYAVTFVRRSLPPVTVRRLGPRTDEFLSLIERCRHAERQAMSSAYGDFDDRLLGYEAPNGWAIDVTDAGTFGGALANAFASADHAEEMSTLAALAAGGMRYGIALQPQGPMPFVLAIGRSATAVESIGDEARATYVFATTDGDALNRALILTSFRREALYLPADQLGRWALAARTVPVVQWARSVFAKRVVHDEKWAESIGGAL